MHWKSFLKEVLMLMLTGKETTRNWDRSKSAPYFLKEGRNEQQPFYCIQLILSQPKIHVEKWNQIHSFKYCNLIICIIPSTNIFIQNRRHRDMSKYVLIKSDGKGAYSSQSLQKVKSLSSIQCPHDRTNNFQGNFIGNPLIQVTFLQFKQVLNHISIF
jgi:hypothetical protein